MTRINSSSSRAAADSFSVACSALAASLDADAEASARVASESVQPVRAKNESMSGNIANVPNLEMRKIPPFLFEANKNAESALTSKRAYLY